MHNIFLSLNYRAERSRKYRKQKAMGGRGEGGHRKRIEGQNLLCKFPRINPILPSHLFRKGSLTGRIQVTPLYFLKCSRVSGKNTTRIKTQTPDVLDLTLIYTALPFNQMT